jgi:hypothetical protein
VFNSVENMVEQAMLGNLESGLLGRAISDHLGTMNNDQLSGHLQTAASNLQTNGQGGLAQQISGIAQQVASNPSSAKDAVVAFVENNPQVLAQFAPEFAQGIMSRL